MCKRHHRSSHARLRSPSLAQVFKSVGCETETGALPLGKFRLWMMLEPDSCVLCTSVVKYGAMRFVSEDDGPATARVRVAATKVRATISFPQDVHATLERIARQKKVSLAWVVREAAEQYIEDLSPLFGTDRERP